MRLADHAAVVAALAIAALSARADTIVGYDLVDRPSDDQNAGNLHILLDAFEYDGPLTQIGIYDADDQTPDRFVTPVIVELQGNDVVIVAVGAPIQTTEGGIQGSEFELVDGQNWVTSDRRFGWFDGSDVAENDGVVDYGPLAAGEPGTSLIAGLTAGDIALGNNLGPGTVMARTYSIGVVMEPNQENCEPPAAPATDSGPHLPIEETPAWSSTAFGTYVDENGDTQDYDVVYHVPADPVALVYVFHGGGGNHSFAENLETVSVLNLLIANGFAFVSTDSTDRETKNWDWWPGPDNAEWDRLLGLRDWLIANTALEANDPLFSYGFSSGSKMAQGLAVMATSQGLDFRAIAANSTKMVPTFRQVVLDVLETPLFIVVGENETPRVCELINARDDLAAQNIPVEMHIALEKAIDPDHFNRLPQVEAVPGRSQEIVDHMMTGFFDDPKNPAPPIIDATGARAVGCNVQLGRLDSMLFYLTQEYGWNGSTKSEVKRQMQVAWALHRESGEFRQEHLEFFLHALRPADLNLDGSVNVADLLALLTSWGPCTESPCWADINRDGSVNVPDLLVLLQSWS